MKKHKHTSSSSHKKPKKHKKHKKSNKSEKQHKKHKKTKKRHRRQSEDGSDAAAVEAEKRGVATTTLNTKFTETMQKASRTSVATTGLLQIEAHSNGNRISIIKPDLQTDPNSLVEEITRTIQNNSALRTMQVVSSESEAEV